MRGLSSPPKLASGVQSLPHGNRIVSVKEEYIGGYGDPPPGFVRGQTSASEWIVYWASFKAFGAREDPRQPPFYGLPGKFSYQSPELGGFIRSIGSAVVDYLYYLGPEMVAVRLQTEFFHLYTDNRKQADDEFQRVLLERKGIRVYDMYDYDVLGDPSGQKAIIAVKRALGLIERVNPLKDGTAIRGTKLKVLT